MVEVLKRINIPKGVDEGDFFALTQRLRDPSTHVSLFAGAGLSRQAHMVNGRTSGLPSWDAFLESAIAFLSRRCSLPEDERERLAIALREKYFLYIGDRIKNHVSKHPAHNQRWNEFLVDEFVHNVEPGPVHELIACIPFFRYITTNYDTLLEKALVRARANCLPIKPASINNLRTFNTAGSVTPYLLWKMHGCVAESEHLVLGQRDYDTWIYGNEQSRSALESLFQQHTVLFVGYSASDPNIQALLGRLVHLSLANTHYMLMSGLCQDDLEARSDAWHLFEIRKEQLEQRGIRPLIYENLDGSHSNFGVFFEALAAALQRTVRMPGESGASTPNRPGMGTGGTMSGLLTFLTWQWHETLCYQASSRPIVKVVFRLPTQSRPLLEAYNVGTDLRIKFISAPDKIFVKHTKPLAISFAGSNELPFDDNLLRAGIAIFDKVYCELTPDLRGDLTNFAGDAATVIEKSEDQFTAIPDRSGHIPYLLRLRELLQLIEKQEGSESGAYRLVEISYLLKAFAGSFFEAGSLQRGIDVRSARNAWELLLHCCEELISRYSHSEFFLKELALFNLLGAIEWYGYLYYDQIRSSGANDSMADRCDRSLVSILRTVICDSSSGFELPCKLEAAWAASWIGLVAGPSLLGTELRDWIAHNESRRSPRLLVSNLQLALLRTVDQKYRFAMATLVARGRSGTIYGFPQSRLAKALVNAQSLGSPADPGEYAWEQIAAFSEAYLSSLE